MTGNISRFMLTALVVGSVAAAGCASGGERMASSSSTTLTQEDMASVPNTNMLEAIERLRPRWLQARTPVSLNTTGAPPQIVVFMNSTYLGGTDELRQFQPADVIEVRYMDGPTASAQLRGYDSSVYVAGAIILVTAQRN